MSNNSTTTVELLETTLAKQAELHNDADQLSKYQEAIAMFNDLIDRGLTKPRGYTLMTVDQAHLHYGALPTSKYSKTKV